MSEIITSTMSLKDSGGDSYYAKLTSGDIPADRSLVLFGGGTVIESFSGVCDGSSVTVPSGTYTLSNVSGTQLGTTTFADVTGSSISYTPPTGTKQVIYEFNFANNAEENNAISCFQLVLDGTVVANSVSTKRTGQAYSDGYYSFHWVFAIGGSADTDTGRVASWTSAKTIKLQYGEHSTSYESALHLTRSGINGSSPSSLRRPTLSITSIG